ncbi:MAG: DUF1841 family protein [Pseudomonadota bacterium]
MIFANSGKDELRQRYFDSWRRRMERLPLEPLDALIADVIELHPEYQAMLADEESLSRPFTVEHGQVNPFLHMGLHLALREQLGTDRPMGIQQEYLRLDRSVGDAHEVEHRMIDVLAETLWEAQRAGRAPDELVYLERLRRL